jgi:hypothetical protein
MATVKVKNKDNEWVSVGSVSMKAQVEPIVLSGNQDYGCAGELASNYIKLFGDTVSTEKISSSINMFQDFNLEKLPFDINYNTSSTHDASHLFNNCQYLNELPGLNNFKPYKIANMFSSCYRLRYIPENWCDNWDWSYINGLTNSEYQGSEANMFMYCYSLRKLPMKMLENGNRMISYSAGIYYQMASYCHSLDEIVDLPYPHYNSTWKSNIFATTIYNCYRLKEFTFKMPEGQPYVANWKSQTIDISRYTGYAQNTLLLDYNSGITRDKEVVDDATYQALKNDPDWWTLKVEYSRYNHDSAVNTINSLPDTSAYLATAGGTNTIKFIGNAGSATDGGAINTLTEEEIAVAAAKGWTVSLV